MEKLTKKLRNIEQLKGQQTRNMTIDATHINEDKRLVTVAFSSELPVERWYGQEILDHQPNSVDLSFLNNGAPVLMDHDPTRQIGVIEDVEISDDKRGRAVLRLSRSEKSASEWQDIKDGIRRHISVGYEIVDAQEEANQVYRVTRWHPYEISFVSLPADATVGVGRHQPLLQEKPMTECTQACSVQSSQERVDNPLTECDKILNFAERVGETEMAREFVIQGKSEREFRDALKAKFKQKQAEQQRANTLLDMSPKETEAYSLLRALDAQLKGNWKKAGLEFEASRTVAERIGRDPKGFFLPFDIQQRSLRHNIQMIGEDKLGGHLVDTHLMSGSYIDLLRNSCLLMNLGMTMLPNLKGYYKIPKQTTASSHKFIREDEAADDSHIELGMVPLVPKTLAGAVPITRLALKEPTLDMEFLVTRDLALGAALTVDYAGLQGKGDELEPKGLLNYDLHCTTYEDRITFENIVKLKALLKKQNTFRQDVVYVGDPDIEAMLSVTEKAIGTAQFLLSGGKLNGYRFECSNQVPENLLIFGDFSSLIMGMWGVLDILPDESTKIASGGLVIRTFQDIGFAIKHIESFALLKANLE